MSSNHDTCLITGAAGFIGQACLPFLIQHRCEIIATTHHKIPNTPLTNNIHVEQIDLFDKKQRVALLKRYQPTHLLHLAWHVPPGEFWTSSLNSLWLDASVELFKEFCGHGGRCFVGAGSLAEYDWTNSELIEDQTPLRPQTVYGQCKKLTYERIKSIQQYYQHVKVMWARIGFYFGEMEPAEKLISHLIKKMNDQEEINLVDADVVRCYAHVRYLGKALVQLLFAGSHLQDVVNVSSAYAYSMEQIVNHLLQLTQSNSVIHYGSFSSKTHEPKRLIPSVQRLSMELGFIFPDTIWNDLRLMVNHFSIKKERSTTS